MKVTLKKYNSEELEFWKYFLHIKNAKENTLTDVELKIMAIVLTGDPYKSMFSGKERKELLNSLDNKYSESYISIYKKSLIDKGFLVATKGLKKDVLVSQPLRDFQFKIKEKIKINEPLSINLEFTFNEV